jgi:hypothetical protein
MRQARRPELRGVGEAWVPVLGRRPQEFRVPLAFHPNDEAESHIIRAGGIESIPFALRVPVAGLYLLSFRGLVDVLEQPVAQELGAKKGTAWTCNRYVLVGDIPAPKVAEAA